MNWRVLLAAASSAALLAATPARADTLVALLASVADAARLPSPLVAAGQIDIDGIKGKTQDRVVLVERAAADEKAPTQKLAAFEAAKVRALARSPSELFLADDEKPKPAKADASVAASSFTVEDFLPFAPERCAAMRIADASDDQFTVICEPKRPPSQYSLMVYKFDREKSVVRQVLLYKDSSTNLVKMLRNDEFTQVGGTWRPKRVVMQDFKLRTKDTLTLEWRTEAKIAAEAFDPKSFAAAALPAAPKP